jgi:hypothetical protein
MALHQLVARLLSSTGFCRRRRAARRVHLIQLYDLHVRVRSYCGILDAAERYVDHEDGRRRQINCMLYFLWRPARVQRAYDAARG